MDIRLYLSIVSERKETISLNKKGSRCGNYSTSTIKVSNIAEVKTPAKKDRK